MQLCRDKLAHSHDAATAANVFAQTHTHWQLVTPTNIDIGKNQHVDVKLDNPACIIIRLYWSNSTKTSTNSEKVMLSM